MAGMSTYARTGFEVRVGVVGPSELVERAMLSGLPGTPTAHMLPSEAELGLHRRLVMAPYAHEHDAPEKVTRLGAGVGALLFASRVPLDYARRAGVLACPATCIQLGGTPLYAALQRARRDGYQPGAASYDGLSRDEVLAGLADAGLAADSAHVHEQTASAAAVASFHERLWRLGQTTAAFTCMESVAARLAGAGVPVLRLRPTDQSIRAGLQVATLLASQHVLAAAQLAVAVAEVPALRSNTRRPAPRHAVQELQLTVYRFLVREATRVQAAVSQAGEHTFLIVGTSGSLAAAGDPPFAAAARTALGIELDVAVGIGSSEHEAEAQARLALSRPAVRADPAASRGGRSTGRGGHAAAGDGAGGPGAGGHGPGSDGRPADGDGPDGTGGQPGLAGLGLAMPDGQPRAGRAADSLSRIRALETLSRLAQKLAADASPVVDAELTGQLLSVTPRTARRQLRALVDEGLALPLPPARQQHPGRPRLEYRLVLEKLDRRTAP